MIYKNEDLSDLGMLFIPPWVVTGYQSSLNNDALEHHAYHWLFDKLMPIFSLEEWDMLTFLVGVLQQQILAGKDGEVCLNPINY